MELANTALTSTNVKQTKTTVIIMKLVLIFLEVFDVNVPKDIQVMGSQVGQSYRTDRMYFVMSSADEHIGGLYCDDFDECNDDTHRCDNNADCGNTVGSYQCRCRIGFNGDGYECFDANECVPGMVPRTEIL